MSYSVHSFSEKTENQQEYTSWHAKSAPKFQQKNASRCTHLYVLTTYLSHWSIKIGKIINVDPWIDSFRALQSTTNKVRSCWACARLITGDELRVTYTNEKLPFVLAPKTLTVEETMDVPSTFSFCFSVQWPLIWGIYMFLLSQV